MMGPSRFEPRPSFLVLRFGGAAESLRVPRKERQQGGQDAKALHVRSHRDQYLLREAHKTKQQSSVLARPQVLGGPVSLNPAGDRFHSSVQRWRKVGPSRVGPASAA